MKDLFSISLSDGAWKWWFSFIVMGVSLAFFNPLFIAVASIVVPIILLLKVSTADQGLTLKNWKKTVAVSFISLVIFTVAVYFFEKLTPGATEANKKVMESFGFGKTISKDLYSIALVCILAPISEELLFRGVIFKSFWNSLSKVKKFGKHKKTIAFWIAMGVSAFFFMSVHGGEGQDQQMLMFFLMSALTAGAYAITGSLYAPILMHSLNNSFVLWGNFEKYGTSLTNEHLKYLIIIAPLLVCFIMFLVQKILEFLEIKQVSLFEKK